MWGRHNALNTRLPPLCPASPPARPAAPLYRAATAPSRSEPAEATRGRPAPALQSRPARASARSPAAAPPPALGRARPGSGRRALRPGRKNTWEPLSPKLLPERRAGSDSPRCLAPGNATAGQGAHQYPERGWMGKRMELGPTKDPAISPPPPTGAPRRPVCSVFGSRRSEDTRLNSSH